MIVEYIGMERFMGYERKCEVDFTGKPIAGIVGNNESGKSSILQAVSYAIHGVTRARHEEQLITSGSTGDMRVSIGLLFPDKSRMEIVRGRTQTGKAILEVSGYKGKPTDLREIIQDKVKLAYDDFVALSYFQQGDIHQFLEGNKREYFNRWTSGLSFWNSCESVAGNYTKKYTEGAREAATRISTAERTLSMSSDIYDAQQASKERVEQASINLASASERVATLEAQSRVSDTMAELQQEFDSLVWDLKTMKRRGVNLKERLAQMKKEAEEATAGNCPLLQIHCEDLAGSKEGTREKLQSANTELRAEYQDLRVQYANASKRYKGIEEKLKHKPDTDLTDQIAEAKAELHRAKQEFEQASRSHAQALVDVDHLKASEDSAKSARAELDKASTELQRWTIVQKMCGKSGIPSLIVDQELVRVESRCNWVLERLGYTKRMNFSGYRELKGWEPECLRCGCAKWHSQTCLQCGAARQHKRKDELTVNILDGSYSRPFELESGGARVLQSFAVRLACSLFLSSLTDVPMRMVMLDEVFAMLDSENRQKLMSLVINKLSREFGLQQQLVVSHHEDVLASVGDILAVSQERGSSVARWV